MIPRERYTRIVQIVRDYPDLRAMNGGAQETSDLTAGYFVFPKFERQIQSDQLQAGSLLCPAKSTSANVNAGKIFLSADCFEGDPVCAAPEINRKDGNTIVIPAPNRADRDPVECLVAAANQTACQAVVHAIEKSSKNRDKNPIRVYVLCRQSRGNAVGGDIFFSKWQQIRPDVDRCNRHACPFAIGIIRVMPAPRAEEYEESGGEVIKIGKLRRVPEEQFTEFLLKRGRHEAIS